MLTGDNRALVAGVVGGQHLASVVSVRRTHGVFGQTNTDVLEGAVEDVASSRSGVQTVVQEEVADVVLRLHGADESRHEVFGEETDGGAGVGLSTGSGGRAVRAGEGLGLQDSGAVVGLRPGGEGQTQVGDEGWLGDGTVQVADGVVEESGGWLVELEHPGWVHVGGRIDNVLVVIGDEGREELGVGSGFVLGVKILLDGR